MSLLYPSGYLDKSQQNVTFLLLLQWLLLLKYQFSLCGVYSNMYVVPNS